MFSFASFNNRVDDILKTLGIPATHAKDHILKSFAGKYFSFPQRTTIKNYSQNKRVATVNQIGAYVKYYLFSSDFAREYQQLREEKRPTAPATIEERVNKEIAEYTRLLKETEDASRSVSPEMKTMYESSIKKYKSRISALENEYDPQHLEQIEGIIIQHDYDMGDYKFKLKQFEKEYPSDVRTFIKIRLQEFLQITSNIDFNAELVQKSGKKIFVNPTYEEKTAAWKYCFRAGRPSTEAARALAQQWLKEI